MLGARFAQVNLAASQKNDAYAAINKAADFAHPNSVSAIGVYRKNTKSHKTAKLAEILCQGENPGFHTTRRAIFTKELFLCAIPQLVKANDGQARIAPLKTIPSRQISLPLLHLSFAAAQQKSRAVCVTVARPSLPFRAGIPVPRIRRYTP